MSSVLIIKGVVRALGQTGIFAALLLIPAGSWRWPRAVQFLLAFAVVQLIVTVVLALLAPASLEARVDAQATKDQPAADRVVTLLLVLTLTAWFVLIPVDVFHLPFFAPVPIGAAVSGAVVLAIGYGVMVTALMQNSFATPVVGDQTERGQILVDTGLYARVRHPMYLGLLLFLLGLSLWLESLAGVLLLPLAFAPILARVVIEERTLTASLPGYDRYVRRVRYRIVPFVW